MRGLEADLARQEFLKRLKGAAFIVTIKVAGILNRYSMLIFPVSFTSGASRLAEDFAARLIAEWNIFYPINGLILLLLVAYVVP